jgi:hypothetical protein
MKTSLLKIAFVFFFTGTCLFLFDVKGLINGYISTTWPSTSGTIIASEINMTLIPHKGGYRKSHHPLVVYTYTVNDVVYTNNRIDHGKQFGAPPQFLSEIINAFPVGSKVIIYYNPEDPTIASIEPGIATATYLYSGAGVLFLMFALISLGISFYISNPTQKIPPKSKSRPATMLQKIDAKDDHEEIMRS